MIEKFSVENFKGFKEKIVFDLSKTRDYTFNNDLIKNGIVNKGIIYGKNGSGKSNLGYALYDITLHLTDKPNPINSYFVYYTNLFSVSKPVIFTYEFNFDGRKITYLYKKTNFNELIYEEVKEDNKILISFDYTKLKETIINVAGAENLRIDLITNQLSILKYIYKNTPPDDSSPITKIVKFAEGMLWFRSLSKGNEFIGYNPESTTLDNIIITNGKIHEFEEFLKTNGLNYQLEVGIDNNNNGRQLILAKFNDKFVPLITIVSSGTKALWLYFCRSIYFQDLTFLFLDEFDAYYHFEIAELIFKELCKNKNMQVFVTSHNTYLMKNSIVRPDCCFIIADNKINSLTDCTDKEIREAHNLEKMYRNGAFTE